MRSRGYADCQRNKLEKIVKYSLQLLLPSVRIDDHE